MLTFGASMVPSTLLPASAPGRSLAQDQIRHDFFASQLGATFRVLQPSAPAVRLKLVQVELAALAHPTAADAANEKFSLLFQGPVTAPLEQNTHTFEHPDTGQFAIFIVPVKTKAAGCACYEAVFNRPAAGTSI